MNIQDSDNNLCATL